MFLISGVMIQSFSIQGDMERDILLQEQKWIGAFILFILEIPGPLHHVNRFVRNRSLHLGGMLLFLYSRFLFFIHYFCNHVYRLWPRFMALRVEEPVVVWGWLMLLGLCTAIFSVNLTWVRKIFVIYHETYILGKEIKKEEEGKEFEGNHLKKEKSKQQKPKTPPRQRSSRSKTPQKQNSGRSKSPHRRISTTSRSKSGKSPQRPTSSRSKTPQRPTSHR